MSYSIQVDAPPIREDESGALRVGDSRVLLELVIQEFQDGAIPEAIVQQFPTLDLSDVYAVIAYYLRHRDELEDYIDQRERLAEEVRQRVEASQSDLGVIRQRLLAKRQA